MKYREIEGIGWDVRDHLDACDGYIMKTLLSKLRMMIKGFYVKRVSINGVRERVIMLKGTDWILGLDLIPVVK